MRAFLLGLLVALALAACGGPPAQPPGGGGGAQLRIGAPSAGQVLSGTVAVYASAVGGSASGLTFSLGPLEVTAGADGVAILPTRGVADGGYSLEARATLGGREVSASVPVTVRNALPASASVGPDGGSLASPGGSVATLPPGAVADATSVSVADTDQDAILAEFGVDYEALGVTFLGALDVESDAAEFALPLEVDLAGWAEAVQPGQEVVMFALAPDADGDGVGELTVASGAIATPDGSVVTRPVARAESYGFGAGAAALRRQQRSARPGEFVTISGRGLFAAAALGNRAEIGGADLIAAVRDVDEAPFNPLQEITVIVPPLPPGGYDLTLRNASTGFRGEPLELTVGAPGAGGAADWNAFTAQLATAAERLTVGRPALAARFAELLGALGEAPVPGDAGAMVRSSGLASPANAAALAAIAPGAYDAAARALVARHALLLDALAATGAEPDALGAAARLLLLADPATAPGPSGELGATRLGGHDVTFGNPCSPAGAGSPGTTGMGAASPPGGSGCGSVDDGGDGDGGDLRTQSGGTSGVLLRVLRPDGGKLTPFTALSDRGGYWMIPFIPEGEPFVVEAIDARSGRTARAAAVGPPTGRGVALPLALADDAVEGAPIARLAVTPRPDIGPGAFEFDAGASADSDGGAIVEYLFDFGDGSAPVESGPTRTHVYTFGGSFDVSLVVTDDEGKIGAASRAVEVPSVRDIELVSVGVGGLVPDQAEGRAGQSADGRYVAFRAAAPDLEGLGRWSDDDDHIYRRDMQTGEIRLVDVEADGTVLAGYPDEAPAISADGRWVVFSTYDASRRLYRKDLQSGALIELGPVISDAADIFYSDLGVSADGNVVAATVCGGNDRICQIVAHDVAADRTTWVTAADGSGGDGHSFGTRLTPDGRWLLFRSYADDLSPDDAAGTLDAFRFDLDSGVLELVSTDDNGAPFSGDVGCADISDDGRYAVLCRSGGATEEEIVRKDLDGGALLRLSDAPSGARSDGIDVDSVDLSGDGRWLTFHPDYPTDPSASVPTLLDLDSGERIRWDLLSTGAAPERVVVDLVASADFVGGEFAFEPRLGGDGRYLTFTASDVPYAAGAPPFHDELIYRLANPLADP